MNYLDYAGLTHFKDKLDNKLNNIMDSNGTIANIEYTFRTESGIAKGAALVKKIYGNTLKFNQLVQTIRETRLIGGVQFTNNGNGSFTLNGTATSTVSSAGEFSEVSVISGHKYYQKKLGSDAQPTESITTSPNSQGVFGVVSGHSYNITFFPMLIDLTQMFGSGNEPSTVEEFKAIFPLDYYSYSAGTLLNLTATGINVRGFNQWDEDVDVGHYVNSSGNVATNASSFCSANYQPCIPNTAYYAVRGSLYNSITATALGIRWYDADKTFISAVNIINTNYLNGTATSPSNAAYFKISCFSWGNVYNHDVCINISGTRNGQYEPYHATTVSMPITSLQGIPSGGSAAEVMFPDGMMSVGDVHDEISNYGKAVKRCQLSGGSVSALTTPVEYTFSPNCINWEYPIENGCTEQLLPVNGAIPVTAPIKTDIAYNRGISNLILSNILNLNKYNDRINAIETNINDSGFTKSEEFIFRTESGIGRGAALTEKVYGNTVKFNQLVNHSGTLSVLRSTRSVNGNIATFADARTSSSSFGFIYGTSSNGFSGKFIPANHKVLMQVNNITLYNPTNYATTRFRLCGVNGQDTSNEYYINSQPSGTMEAILTTTDVTGICRMLVYSTSTVTTPSNMSFSCDKRITLIDLTEMYGSAISGMTDSQILAYHKERFPLDYYSYSAGTLLNLTATGIKLIGKNLLKIDNTTPETVSGVTYTPLGDGRVQCVGTANGSNTYMINNTAFDIGNAKKIRVSISGNSQIGIMLYLYDANGNTLESQYTNTIMSAHTINVASYPGLAKIKIGLKRNANTAVNEIVCPQVEIGETATSFEPYHATTVSMPITSLQGIPSGGSAAEVMFPDGEKSVNILYGKDINSQQYIGELRDEISSGIAIKNIGSITLNGTQTITKRNSDSTHWLYQYDNPSIWGQSGTGGSLDYTYLKCDNSAFMLVCNRNIITGYDTSTAGTTTGIGIGYSNEHRLYINMYGLINTNNLSSVNAYFTAHPTTVYFKLTTPVIYTFSPDLCDWMYPTDNYYTKQLLPINGTSPITSPIIIDTTYDCDLKSIIFNNLKTIINHNKRITTCERFAATLTNILPPEYVPLSTYNTGSICMYNGSMYRATANVSGEQWNPGHWTSIRITDL